jgi:hypothetical protein
MRYKTLKRITKYYDEIWSKERAADEIQINTHGVEIDITEQQVGVPLPQPNVNIYIDGITYSMNWNVFLSKIKS